MHVVKLSSAMMSLLACSGDGKPPPVDDTGGETEQIGDSGAADTAGDDSGATDSGATDSGTTDSGTTDSGAPEPAAIGESVLILGPGSGEPEAIAEHLQALIEHDGLAEGTRVDALELPSPASPYISEMSLMTAWYQATDRDERMASFEGEWDHVILIETTQVTGLLPEFTFEGLHTLGGHFEDRGSAVHLLLEAPRAADGYDFDAAVENSYRVADGTGAGLVPAGLASRDVDGADDWGVVAATSIYSSLRGVSAARVEEAPDGMAPEVFAVLADDIHALVAGEAGVEHYSGDYDGPVKVADRELPASYGVMVAGTSSERNYLVMMQTFLSERGITNHAVNLGQCNDYRQVDAGCVEDASGHFEADDYVSLLARGYTVDHSDVVAAGGGDIQSQLYDRHWDATDSDGLNALDELDARLAWVLIEAAERDLAMIPHHLFWARFHDVDPDAVMLNDGVHASDPILYGISTMSFVAATGGTAAAEGLSDEHAAISELAEACLRQWSTLQE